MSIVMITNCWQGTEVTNLVAIDAPASAMARPRHGQVVVLDAAQNHQRSGVK